uniref:Uncharacterized protein n=1 Tax=Onchocerca volvulus TaxID=6282 RepID=A0A8R1Y507_ONCVO
MAGLFRSLSQRFRRSKRHYHPDGNTAGTSEYQQVASFAMKILLLITSFSKKSQTLMSKTQRLEAKDCNILILKLRIIN